MTPFLFQCLLLVLFFPASGAEEFLYNGFTNANLTFEGEASIDERGRLALTTGLDVGGIGHAGIGHAFYRYPVSFRKNPSDPAAPSFSTTFMFETTTLYDYTYKNGSGLAFVLSSSNKFMNESLPDQYLGLFNMSSRGNKNILAIELGDIVNPKLNSIDDNQVAININSFNSTSSSTAGSYYGSYGWHSGFRAMKLAGEGAMQLWVEYDGKTQLLNVTLGSYYRERGTKPEYPLLSSLVNLSSLLHNVAYIGFSASTSIVATRHYILGWSFKKNGQAPELNISALEYSVTGGWGNYFPPPPILPRQEQKARTPLHRPSFVSLLGISCFILLAIFAVLGYVYNRRHLKKTVKQDWELNCGPPSFTYKDLLNATSGFKDQMLLGKGGFGKVYKGLLLATKQNVAIKRISPESKQGMKEFISEITILGHVRHRRLVHLLGYCRHKHELLLVYDYMPNGSLDKYLYGQDKPPLCWSQRFNIIKDVASGLLYLHEEWERVVIHRDIKSSNVLLDDEMNGRLGDFGLARLHDHGVDAHTTRVAGTFGYIAPELARLGKATKATDVFAFGVFMMEVTCGRRPVEVNACGEPQVLAEHVINAWQDGSIMDSRDPRLEDCVAKEVEMVLKLGLLCSHPSPKVRPGMRLVTQYLESFATLPDFPLSFFNPDPANDSVYDQFVASYPSVATATTSLSGGR
jgi:hypothetical protein